MILHSGIRPRSPGKGRKRSWVTKLSILRQLARVRPSKIIPLIPPIITELINNNNYSHYYRAGIPIIREPGQRGANRHVFCTKLTKICILLPDRPPQKPLRSDFQSPKTFSEQKGHIFSTEFTRQSDFPNLTRFFPEFDAIFFGFDSAGRINNPIIIPIITEPAAHNQ